MTQLEDAGWDCKLIGNEKHYAVRAEYGPLVVLGFKGTTELKDLITDFDLIRLAVTECGQQGCAHRGIYSYAKQLPVSLNALFDPDKGDELLILTGHSLGGAVAQIKGFEAYDLFANSELTGFCSIATFGAPAVLDKSLKTRLNQIFPGYSNVQFRFENDGVALFTRGPTLMLPEVTTVDSVRSVFKHTGSKVILKSKGWFSHSMDECLKVLKEKNDQILFLWPNTHQSSDINVSSLDNIPESVLASFSSSQTETHIRGLQELYRICLTPSYKVDIRFAAWLELYNYYALTSTKVPRKLIKLTRDLIEKRSYRHFNVQQRQLDPNGAIGIIKVLLNSKEVEVRKFALQQLRIIITSYPNEEIRQSLPL